MSKLVVTGGAGFIGSHLTDELIRLGHEVVVVDNLMLGKKEFINKKAKFYKKDIRDYKSLKKIFKNTEAIFHLAADPRLPISIENPLVTNDINVNGTLNVLWAAKENQVDKVVFSSSCAVYGLEEPPFKEDAIVSPVSPYGLHKLIGENYCKLFSKLYALKTVSLRYFNVFGPRKLATGAYPMVIPIFLNQKSKNVPMTIVGNGLATRDYVHVRDVVRANILAWQSEVTSGSVINIGSGNQTSVNEIADLIGGSRINIPARIGEMASAAADNTRAKTLLGWEPAISLEEGIAELKKEWGIE